MELKQIKELMGAMGRTGMKRLKVKREDFELELEREENGSFKPIEFDTENENPLRADIEQHRAAFVRGASAELAPRKPAAEEKEEVGTYITSPMVGTFYQSPAPEEPPFVKVGDKVDKNTVVCIIEAMKVMNEVKAGTTGTVAEVLIETGHPVEFGTKLIRIV